MSNGEECVFGRCSQAEQPVIGKRKLREDGFSWCISRGMGTFEVRDMGIYPERQLAFAGAIQQSEGSALKASCTIPSWFRGIPPERVGLDGKYDHYGLQKRVVAAFEDHCELGDFSQLSVSQRGRVVILQGDVPDEETLKHLIAVAERVEGTIRVEVSSVVVSELEPIAASVPLERFA